MLSRVAAQRIGQSFPIISQRLSRKRDSLHLNPTPLASGWTR
jgi:hypothetical protein